jgi:D-xylulose kinase
MLIGVDIGTSTTKAILMRRDGSIVKAHNEAYGIDTPRPGWAEQNPNTWVEKAIKCIRAVAEGHQFEVKGLSFSGQMHGIVLVNESGSPLRPAIIHLDARSSDALDEIYSRYSIEELCGVIFNRPAAGFGLTSLVWLKKHEPHILEKTRYVLSAKDYVRFKLCGEIGQEYSDASGICCLDVRNRVWAYGIFNGLGLPESILPSLAASTAQAGTLTATASRETTLPAGVPVFFGGADNGVAGIGSGVVEDGTMAINIGTGGQCGTIASSPLFDKEFRTSTFCHSLSDRWNLFGGSLSAGLSMKWFRDSFFPGQDFAILSELAAKAKPGAEGVLFLPYLTGERTPWLDPKAKGVFWGLSLHTGPAEMARAVMEGVSFALEQGYSILLEAGVKVTRMLSMGGGAKSAIWPQIQADVFGIPIETASGGDACIGAAILAGVGTGIYPDVETAVKEVVRLEGKTFTPEPSASALYREKKELFRELYLANKDLFARQ